MSKMTLEQVRDNLRKMHAGIASNFYMGQMADAIDERIRSDERAVGSEWPYIEIVTLAWSKLRERDCLPEEWHEGDMVRALQAVWPKPPSQPTKLEDAVREVQWPSDESILGAVARGWCHEANSRKVMDADLAKAIAQEIAALQAVAPPKASAKS